MSNAYHNLATSDFSQNWTGTSALLTTGSWSGIPSIIGYRGDGMTSNTATDPQTTLADGSGTPVDLINASTSGSNTGGIHEIENDVVALQGSGTADAPHLVIHVDTTGRQSVTLTALLRELDSSAVDQKFAVQYRVGETGNFTNLPDGAVSSIFNAAGNQTASLNVVLPAAADNQSKVQIRIITNDAPGSDAMIGIDDILVSSQPAGASATLNVADVSIVEGDAGTSELTFTVTRSNDTTAFNVNYGTADGTATAGSDYASASGTLNFAVGGALTQTVSVTINGDTDVEASETLLLNLSGISNTTGTTTFSDASGTGTMTNDDVSSTAGISIGEVSIVEGDSGTQVLQFTVTRDNCSPSAPMAQI